LKASFHYDERLEPPAPVLDLRIGPPAGEAATAFQALVDTGADCTLVPEATARALRLPAIGEMWIEGVAGASRRATVHAARVEFAGVCRTARVVSLGDEAILGRDLLNGVVALFDGPALTLSLTGVTRPRRSSRRAGR
jgi:predicted aspartyl protease